MDDLERLYQDIDSFLGAGGGQGHESVRRGAYETEPCGAEAAVEAGPACFVTLIQVLVERGSFAPERFFGGEDPWDGYDAQWTARAYCSRLEEELRSRFPRVKEVEAVVAETVWGDGITVEISSDPRMDGDARSLEDDTLEDVRCCLNEVRNDRSFWRELADEQGEE